MWDFRWGIRGLGSKIYDSKEEGWGDFVVFFWEVIEFLLLGFCFGNRGWFNVVVFFIFVG